MKPSWYLVLTLFSLISFNSIIGIQSKDAPAPSSISGTKDVKCREHIEEALRQYWDHEKGEYVPITEESDESNESSSKEAAESKSKKNDPTPPTTASKVEQPKANTEGKRSNDKGKEKESDSKDDSGENETKESKETDDTSKSSVEKAALTKEDSTESDEKSKESKEESKEDSTEENVTDESEEKVIIQPKSGSAKQPTAPAKQHPPPPPAKQPPPPPAKQPPPTQLPKAAPTPATKTVPPPATKPTTTPPPAKVVAAPAPKAAEVKKAPEPVKSVPAKAQPVKDEKKNPVPDKKGSKAATTTPAPESDESEESSEEDVGPFRSRSQVEDILKLYEIGSKGDIEEQNLITATFKDLKKIHESSVKPMEQLYKYKEISNRLMTDAEIFSKPTILFLGSKSSGKTSLVNYLLGLESTPFMLRTGSLTAPPHFTILQHGDTFSRLSPMEVAADFTFSSLQQFGQYFIENHVQSFKMALSILQRVTIVDSPGLMDGLLNRAPEHGKGVDQEVYQWFVDRSDIIFIVVDINQIHLTNSLQQILEQLRGRDVRFIITKSDTVSQTQCVMMMGQLLWSLSPVMPSDMPPKVYALTTSLTEVYNPFLDVQEQEFLQDLSNLISGLSRVESRASSMRRHAVRVRNHAKIVDKYVGVLNRNRGFFQFGASVKKLGQEITENPHQYNIFAGTLASLSQNVSRFDLPDPALYREFFRANPVSDFKALRDHCSFFSGCPIDKLDTAISYRLPDLVAKYKRLTKTPKKK